MPNILPLVKGKDIAFTIQPQVGSTRAQAVLSSLVNRFYLLDANGIQSQTIQSQTIQSQTSAGYVYVIHFADKPATDKPATDKLAGRAQHYNPLPSKHIGWVRVGLGFTEQLDRLLFVHRSRWMKRRCFILLAGGRGARILNACNLHSYGIVIVFKNVTRRFERYLKDRKKTNCFCPVCLSELTLF